MTLIVAKGAHTLIAPRTDAHIQIRKNLNQILYPLHILLSDQSFLKHFYCFLPFNLSVLKFI
jgi:hypothetical protein